MVVLIGVPVGTAISNATWPGWGSCVILPCTGQPDGSGLEPNVPVVGIELDVVVEVCLAMDWVAEAAWDCSGPVVELS